MNANDNYDHRTISNLDAMRAILAELMAQEVTANGSPVREDGSASPPLA